MEQSLQLVVCVSSAASNTRRRRALRRSWFTFWSTPGTTLAPQQQQALALHFVVAAPAGSECLTALHEEQAQHGDMLLLDVQEGYEHLWRKALVSLALLEQRYNYCYYMHADDDSYVRLDLMLQLLARSPRQRFYWGYIWDGSGNRVTAPIRNPRNKSHMPVEQYALDYYPPFASGCGFVLSRDLVQALLAQPLPDYRLLDPPFGIHLCGTESCVVPGGPVQPVHDERVRPYRGLPIFQPGTLVQHYLAPEEMAPFHAQVLDSLQQQRQQHADAAAADGSAAAGASSGAGASSSTARPHAAGLQQQQSAADQLYAQLVGLGLLRR